MYDAENGVVVLDGKDGREDRKGCGARYYMGRDIKLETHGEDVEIEGVTVRKWPLYIECSCGARLRANANLRGYQK